MRNNFGVTFIELSVTLGIIVILLLISVPVFLFFQRRSELNNSVEEIISTLRSAQNKTLASEGASQYGVYFDSSAWPHQYTLFKGLSFASRDGSFDKVYNLPTGIEIYGINLSGGGNETVFDRLTGNASPDGNVSLRLKTEPANSKTIYVESSGQLGLTPPSVPSDEARIKNSRHIHFDYSRQIATSETLALDFISKTENILIANNLKDGQIYWEGEVEVDSELQKLKIHTHRFNNPDTQFSVHRDRRYNNKTLEIEISEDVSGNLISYTADGQESRGTSIFLTPGSAGDPQRQ